MFGEGQVAHVRVEEPQVVCGAVQIWSFLMGTMGSDVVTSHGWVGVFIYNAWFYMGVHYIMRYIYIYI